MSALPILLFLATSCILIGQLLVNGKALFTCTLLVLNHQFDLLPTSTQEAYCYLVLLAICVSAYQAKGASIRQTHKTQ
jgi:hypothetical protein